MSSLDYHGSCLPKDERRDVLWQALCRIGSGTWPAGRLRVDLGAGHCDFINADQAWRRIAVDAWDGFSAHLQQGIEHKVGSVTDLDFLEEGQVGFASASNQAWLLSPWKPIGKQLGYAWQRQ